MGHGDKHWLDRTSGPTTVDRLPGYIIGGSVGGVAIVAMAGILVAVLAMVVVAGCVAVVAITTMKGRE